LFFSTSITLRLPGILIKLKYEQIYDNTLGQVPDDCKAGARHKNCRPKKTDIAGCKILTNERDIGYEL